MRCPILAELPPPPSGKTGWPWTEESPQLSADMPDGAKWPKISIVTPSYNQGQFLEETIRSVLLQGYPNLQYIVMDGGSKDASVPIIERYAKWISHWVTAEDDGQSDAINKGFENANGALMGFLNSDDLYERGAFGAAALSVRSHSFSSMILLAGRVQDFGASGNLAVAQNDRLGEFHEWVCGGVSLHQPGTFWTRDLWLAAGPFPAHLRFTFDRYFFARCCALGARFEWLPSIVAKFRLHESSKTCTSSAQFSKDWETSISELLASVPIACRRSASIRISRERATAVAQEILSADTLGQSLRTATTAVVLTPTLVLQRPFLGALRRTFSSRLIK